MLTVEQCCAPALPIYQKYRIGTKDCHHHYRARSLEFPGLERPHSEIPRMTLKWNIVERTRNLFWDLVGFEKFCRRSLFRLHLLSSLCYFNFQRRIMNPDFAIFLRSNDNIVTLKKRLLKKMSFFLSTPWELKNIFSCGNNWRMVFELCCYFQDVIASKMCVVC